MIPLRLQLHNFMSYGDAQSLDFSGIDLACLSGDNGVGKSTLLDAVTWALWGKCRAAHDDDLVRQGTQDMWVSFEFDLEGQKYRVVRKRSKRGKGQGSLEFLVQGNKNTGQESFGNWTSLTSTSKAETQQKIIDTLRMQYDTFINSAFLRQGHADEFTIKRPAERKTILGEILGLLIYDQLEAQAKEQVRSKKIEKESLETVLEDIKTQLQDKNIYKKQVEEIEKSLMEASREIKEKEKKVKKLQDQKEKLEFKASQSKELETKIADFRQDIQELNEDIKKHDQIIKAAQKLILTKQTIEENFAKYKENVKLLDIFNYNLSKQLALNKQKTEIERNISEKKHDIEIKKGKVLAKLEEIRNRLARKAELSEAKIKKEKECEVLIGKENELVLLQKDFHKIKERLAEMRVETRQIKQKGEETKERISSLSKAKAICPLCGQSLTSQHRQEIIEELEKQLGQKRIDYKNISEKETAFKQRLENLEVEIKGLELKLAGKQEVERKLAEVNKDLKEIEGLDKEEKKLTEEDEILNVQVKEGKFDKEGFEKLAEIEKKIKEIGYDEKKHGQLREKVLSQEKYGELKAKLDKAEEKMTDSKRAKARIEEIVERKKEAIQNDTEQKEKLMKDLKGLGQVKERLDEENKELAELRAKVSGVEKGYGAAKEKYERLIKLEQETKEKKKKLEKVSQEVALYNELALAFSKKGVQAMIIESAVPEIEEEANRLLSKMTDGKMRVEFRTQREKKTDGELAETLDIQIADEQGIRPYEMFSGGEAYRINFAIRIALSKLLARRAGAKLQFLVIDEGFGTQDIAGREHLVEAINSVSSDFKKILVITHVPELRDVFPTRIEVTKDEEGSHFRMVG